MSRHLSTFWRGFRVANRLLPCAACVLFGCALAAAAEPTKREAERTAASALREALQREMYGLAAERSAILASVAADAPDYAPLRWQQGYVRDARRGWIRADEYAQNAAFARRLAEYERERAAAADTVAGQLALAAWCADHKLPQQQRAHLTRVIDLDADNAAARRAMGFVRRAGSWVSPQEIAADAAREESRRADLAEWHTKIEQIREGLEHRSLERREFAAKKLREITDPAAIAAIEEVFDTADAGAIGPALDALAAMDHPEAALSLSRFAAFSSSLPIRQAAAERLATQPLDRYVPQLLASMYSPVVSRFMAITLPTGRIGYRHAFVREGQDKLDVMLLDTEYRRVALVGGSRRESTERAFADAVDTARTREEQLAQQNRVITQINDRLAWVLKTATGQDLPASPEEWWQWWNQHNEVFVSGSKPTSVIQQTARVTIQDSVPESGSPGGVSFGSSGGSAVADCLKAGTLVWTAEGPREIERIQIGDLVLAQHPDSGELAYQPVLRTTIRPKGRLVRIEAGGQVIETSGGHLFWVSGEGWTKSRNLKSGQVLHTAEGPLNISLVEPGSEAETYNLVVADFNTYFVGYGKILSHDNTVRQPTAALVPGLITD